MKKPAEALYVDFDRKLAKWRLVGMDSKKVFGLFDSKKESMEYYAELVTDKK